MRWLRMAAFAVALAAGQTPAGAQSPQDVLISLPSYPAAGEARRWRINDSQWGYIARFNAALAERLSACSDAEERVAAALRLFPHRFTIDSIHGLEQLEACDPQARFGAGNGEVAVAAWTYVTGGAPLPSVMERARAIVFRRSADTPDYDMTLWDLERPRYDSSIFTWGPFHATIGEGCTLRRVLRGISAADGGQALLADAFRDEPAVLQALIGPRPCSEAVGREIVAPVFADAERKERFRTIFNELAAHTLVRNNYDEAFLGPGNPRSRQLRQYYELYQAVGLAPNGLDFAFILDHALTTRNDRPEWMNSLISDARSAGMRRNAEVRQFISRQYLSPDRGWVSSPSVAAFRRGRDVAYFIDAVGYEGLTDAERTAWIDHSRLRASNVGLTDDGPPFYPCGLSGRTNDCEELLP